MALSRAELRLQEQQKTEKKPPPEMTTTSSSSAPVAPAQDRPQADLKREIATMDIRELLEKLILQQDTIVTTNYAIMKDNETLVANSNQMAKLFSEMS